MLDLNFYVTLLIIMSTSVVMHFYYKNRLNNVIQSFLNAHDNIIVLVHGYEISMINKAGLKVLGYDSLKSFKMAHADISDFFVDNEVENSAYDRDKNIEYIDKYTHGKKWVEMLSKREKKQVRVKIFSKKDNFDHFYQIRISKLNSGNDYSLSFTDITELEANRLRIKKTAEYDPLTKIFNRVKINEVFEQLAYNVKKYNHNLTLILFDIDHFKMVNDTYGHNAGDSVLKELSALVKSLLRNEDIFARWGGEEFVVLLQGTSLAESAKLASRLRSEIERFHFNIVGKVTCSFGVSQFGAGDTEQKFFGRVDEALYEAKEKGRNQVITK